MTDEEMINGNGVPELERLRAIMHRLRAPGGCPWDAEQTHESIVPNLIEEAYETVDAIKRGDDTDIREELGDLLLQVVFHSEIAQETGRFSTRWRKGFPTSSSAAIRTFSARRWRAIPMRF